MAGYHEVVYIESDVFSPKKLEPTLAEIEAKEVIYLKKSVPIASKNISDYAVLAAYHNAKRELLSTYTWICSKSLLWRTVYIVITPLGEYRLICKETQDLRVTQPLTLFHMKSYFGGMLFNAFVGELDDILGLSHTINPDGSAEWKFRISGKNVTV